MITVTLNDIQAHDPCARGWSTLTGALGVDHPRNKPIPLLTILEINGLDDALGALRCVTGHERELRLFACRCACLTLPLYEQKYPGDNRPRYAIEAAALYAEGLETTDATDATRAAADAARAATDAAWAATDAAWAAADAAWAARAAWATTDAADAAGAAADAAWAAADAADRIEIETLFKELCNA